MLSMSIAQTPANFRIRRLGWLANIFYYGALIYYLYVRIRYTLSGLGPKYEWYGIVLLVVECFGATTIAMYGLNLLWRPVHEKYPPDPEAPGKPLVSPSLPSDNVSDAHQHAHV